jgi:hypothetical protein
MIALSLTNTQSGADGKAGFLWLNRIAYPSEIDGGRYYNIRAPGYGGGGVELDSSGPNPIPRGEADWVAPDHAAREYWIAKADISEDGLLRLRFIVIAGWDERNDIPAGIEQHRKIHGQGDSFWFETCGKHCGYARANLHPDSLIEMIRTVPSDDLFGATAGPFTRFETAAPEFDYSGFSAR